MTNLTPTKIVDKNGKQTTVYKKVGDVSSSSRVKDAPPLPMFDSSPEVSASLLAPAGTKPVSDIKRGERFEMTYGEDHSVALAEDEFIDLEARAFQYIVSANVTGEALFEGSFAKDVRTDWKQEHRAYATTLRNSAGREMTVKFHSGMGISDTPTLNDVLYSVAIDASGVEGVEFISWADEMGYELEPVWERKNGPVTSEARKVYRAARSQTDALKEFIGDDEAFSELVYGG